MSSIALLPIEAANTMMIGWCGCIALWLSKMQNQKLLMLHWRWFFGDGSDKVGSILAHIGGRYYHYGLTRLYCPVIIQNAKPKIFDAPLMFIFRRW